MSHTTKIKKVPIKDVAALLSAVDELIAKGVNCEMLRDQSPRMYFSHQNKKCDYVLHLKDSRFDLGFEKQKDGTYGIMCDLWAGEIASQIGATCRTGNFAAEDLAVGQFMQAYSKHATINAAVNAGHMVESCFIDTEGNVQLSLMVS